jgi:hypothetical protein
MVAGALVLVVVLLLGIHAVGEIWPTDPTIAADTGTPDTTSAKMKKVSGKTNEDRVGFITSYGWEVEEDPAEIMEVIIPEEFDEVYLQCNNIQKAQGCNLEDYAGKRCKRYAYTVTNYPGTDQPIRANLLIYKNKVVGGDICSLDANGFIHGFEAPAQ